MSGRPKEYDDARVIDAAMDVFWNSGYEASSTQELCERTGLGRGSLYHAFGSKQNLYEQALRRYQELGLKAQLEILQGSAPVKARLRALLQWVVNGGLDPEGNRPCMALFSTMESGNKNPVIEGINQAYLSKLEAAICSTIAIGQQSGELSSDRPATEVARVFLASYCGLNIFRHSVEDKTFLTDVLEGTVARL